MVESGSSSISTMSWGSDLAAEACYECTCGGSWRHEPVSPLLLQPDILCRQNPCYDDDDCAPSSCQSSKRLLICQRHRAMPQKQDDKEWSSMVLMMKEIFAKLLLGGDFSGGSKGSSAALTISNAITKLSVAIFGNLPRLEPLSEESELKWRREMEWLVSPCDYIVELEPSRQSLQDGTIVEVMASKPRADVYVGLPALQKLDGMLVDMLRSFTNTEFRYTERVCNISIGCDFRDCGMWFPHSVEVPASGLSEKARNHLAQERESANQILKAARSINEHVLAEMEIPESYWQMLPKSGKKVMGDSPSLRIVVASEHYCLETLLSSLDCHSHKNLLNLASGLEALIHIWTMKIRNKLKQQAPYSEGISCGATPTWAHVSKDTSLKKVEKKRKYVQRARNLLTELRHRFPGVLQTALEVSKIKHNKDVGHAVLESYSRALVNLAARIETRIAEVIAADKDVLFHIHPDPLILPGTSCIPPQGLRKLFSDVDNLVHIGMQLDEVLLLHHPIVSSPN